MLEAMKLGLEFLRTESEDPLVAIFIIKTKKNSCSFLKTVNIISPNEIKQLLYYVLTTNSLQPGVEQEQW